MEVTTQSPSGGWHTVLVNGKIVAMVRTEKLAQIIAEDIKLRHLLGKDCGA